MRALWRLTINSLAGRRGRTVLLVLAVALATVLTVAVASAIGTVSRSVGHVVGRVAGLTDLSVRHRFNGQLSPSLLALVRSWPEVALAGGHVEGEATLRLKGTSKKHTLRLRGVEPPIEALLSPRDYLAGRPLAGPGEMVVDPRLQKRLDARVGDVVEVLRVGGATELTLVGVYDRPRLAVLQRRTALVELAQAQALLDQKDKLAEIRIRLRGGARAEAVAAAREASLPPEAALQTSASARAGLNRQLRFAQLALLTLTVLASLASGFLILTSLTTSVTQQTREMAILRCIGASRAQLAGGQLAAGALIALLGAAIGVPLGLLASYGLYRRFADALPGGFAVNPSGVAWAVGGVLLAGLLGAAYPALLAATARPMEALTIRARPPRGRHVLLCAAVGAALAMLQPAAMLLSPKGQWVFWFWPYVGLGATFVGFFLLSVPLLAILARAVAPALSRVLRLPGSLLRESVLATPMRQGFTAGTLMVGLALLVAVWTQSRSALGGWFESLRMPDAFVYKFPAFSESQWQALSRAKAVREICPTSMFPVQAVGLQFGVRTLSPPKTMFVATDIEPFLAIAHLEWLEGDRPAALRRLAEGRALLVSREWSVAHGVGVGATLTLETAGGAVAFEVVGVIGATGLDLATHVFGTRRRMQEASIGSVFGTRQDARRHFKATTVNLALVRLRDDVGDEEAVKQLTAAAPGSRAGTSRGIRRGVEESTARLLTVASTVAVGALALACIGVGNLIVAEVRSRRYEFGVLRAIGATRGVLGRLVAGQTVIVALVGCGTGTALGVTLALIERGFHRRLLGLDYAARLPWDVIALGALAVVAAAVLAALPAIWGLLRTSPRALFARRD